MSFEITRELLADSLSIAVPMAINEFYQFPELVDEYALKLPSLGPVFSSRGDELIFKSSKKGETAKLFTQLAYAVAYLCIVNKSGVTIFGRHFKSHKS